MRRRPAAGHRVAEAERPAAAISAADVRVLRGGRPVVDGVTLEVRPGEVLALLGPNGAGKSTLLGALAGDHRPDGGRVELDGREVTDWAPVELARRRGVLLQDVTVSFPFTVDEVVRMGRSPWPDSSPEEDERVVSRSTAACDVTHLLGRTFPTLSGGERARAALARVLAQGAPLLLLDEPTAALDLQHQEMVMATARSHADAGGAVVVVLHDLTLAAAWADRVALLHQGRLVGLGGPADVLRSDLLSAVYGCPVEVLPHPVSGAPIVLAARSRAEGLVR